MDDANRLSAISNNAARGQLKTAGVADGAGNWAFQLINYHYLEDGRVDHQDYGNGVRTDMSYDGRGFSNYTHSYRTGSYQSYADRTYYRDNRDRIWSFQKGWDASANPKENGRGDRFFYDYEGQLTQAYYECADPTGNFNSWRDGDVYNYDALGNRAGGSWVASLGSVNWTRRDNGLNQYLSWSPSAINYEGNGVLTQEGWISSDYNALNQPLWMWTWNLSSPMYFGYDPLGRCVKRWFNDFSAPPTYLYYNGWSLIQEGENVWSPTRLYVQGNRIDELEVTFNVVTSQYGFHQYDARGHCILTTDISGNMMEEYDYDAWGKPHFYSGSSWWSWDLGYSEFGNRFLFTGREWLSDLGVYDYRNRLYHPELGRFLQPDPKEFAAGDYNLYRYCHNDPVNRSDPMGLYAPEIDDKKTQAQFDQLKEKSQAFRDQFKKWEGDKEKRSIKSASDPGNFKGRNQSPTKNGPGNSTEPQSILGKIASWLRGGQGRGGTIYYNPNNRATAQGRDREPILGFAHELGHLIDIGNGNYSNSLVPSAAETRAGENSAIGWEREAQSAFGETNLRPYQ